MRSLRSLSRNDMGGGAALASLTWHDGIIGFEKMKSLLG
jgi:hypothetical protein